MLFEQGTNPCQEFFIQSKNLLSSFLPNEKINLNKKKLNFKLKTCGHIYTNFHLNVKDA